MNKEMLEKIRINKTGKIRDPAQAAKTINADENSDGPVTLNLSDIEGKLNQDFEAGENHELEIIPRATVKRMLEEKKYDEPFVFKVHLGQGANYVQAMRQVLSRARKKALRKKIRLEEFKLFELAIESKEDHDIVRLVRVKNIPAHLTSVYDELLNAFKREDLTVPAKQIQERTV